MPRPFAAAVLAGFFALLCMQAFAAPAPADLFTISDIRVDATAESAIAARDLAMKQGRPDAWAKLYRRLTASSQWPKQPMLDENQLLRLVRGFEVNNERRSTTRYLADVTYHFNPVAVRAVLRQHNIAYTDTRSKPALVISLISGKGFDRMSPWSMVWRDPVYAEGLVPVILPEGDAQDREILSRPDLTQLDWAGFMPLVEKYGAGSVVLAIASEDAKTVQAIEISMAGRVPSSFAFAQSNFMADAGAIIEKVADTWKGRTSLDYGTRGRLTADVQFGTLADWARIRTRLGQVRSVSNFSIVGLAANEAEIDISYFGRMEQLREALAGQSLALSGTSDATYTLQLGGTAAAQASP